MHFAPFRTTVPLTGPPSPDRTSNRTVLACLSTIGSIHVFFPGFVDTQNDLTRGILARQPGFGLSTVLAHSQAMTVASPPPCSFGSFTFGYRWPIRFSASSRIHLP